LDALPYLISLISKVASIPESEVRPDATPRLLDIDSLSLVEIAVCAEGDLGIRVDNEDLLPDYTVAAMAATLNARLAAASCS
jgi:acyl carrier protein